MMNQVDKLQNNEPSYVQRAWGSFTVLDKDSTFKAKKIVVKPGKSLSLQRHFHRSEHWIVVSGTAQVTIEAEVIEVFPNQSIYIPIGKKHCLANPGKIDLVIIEVQVGEYTGEDDIIRFDVESEVPS